MRLQRQSSAAFPRKQPDPDWQQALPTEWRTMAVTPLDFAVHQEYEMPACRALGYDVDGAPCYYRHAYILSTPRSDDDEEFYEAVVYGEEVEAWRLRDERWLVWRIVRQGDDCRSPRGFYAFSETMPR